MTNVKLGKPPRHPPGCPLVSGLKGNHRFPTVMTFQPSRKRGWEGGGGHFDAVGLNEPGSQDKRMQSRSKRIQGSRISWPKALALSHPGPLPCPASSWRRMLELLPMKPHARSLASGCRYWHTRATAHGFESCGHCLQLLLSVGRQRRKGCLYACVYVEVTPLGLLQKGNQQETTRF